MTPEAITLHLKEATEAFTVIDEKPSDDDILAIHETLLPLLMDIPFNLVGGVHSLTGLITELGGPAHSPATGTFFYFFSLFFGGRSKEEPLQRRPIFSAHHSKTLSPIADNAPSTNVPADHADTLITTPLTCESVQVST